MACSAASYILMLDEQSLQDTKCFIKTPFQMKHCFVSLHNMKHLHYRFDMKHSAYAPYDLSSIALRATDDEKMKNESCVDKYSQFMLYYPAESLGLKKRISPSDLSNVYEIQKRYIEYLDLNEKSSQLVCPAFQKQNQTSVE